MPSESAPILSSVVLNWNRSDLLERTVRSYFETVSVPHELTVVDNASTDDSLEVLSSLRQKFPSLKIVSLPVNRGGESLNAILCAAQSEFLHISENDVEYRPGWDQHLLSCFSAFPRLGQLSPFGPVPEDSEVWEIKSGRPCYGNDQLVYVTEDNVGTTCVLRRALWEQGLRVFNLPHADASVHLPDDGRLSRDARALGYWVAWSEHYLAANLGHTRLEFEHRQSYYHSNYEAKPWLRIEGWQQRIQAWEARPRPLRQFALFPNATVSGEMAQNIAMPQRALLWSMMNGFSGELEVLECIHALVRTLKPLQVLETESGLGYVTVVICEALRLNGQGQLTALTSTTVPSTDNLQRLKNHAQLRWGSANASPGFTSEPSLDCLIVNGSPERVVSDLLAHALQLRSEALVLIRCTECNGDELLRRTRGIRLLLGLHPIIFRTPRGFLLFQFQRTLRLRLISPLLRMMTKRPQPALMTS